MDTPITIVGAGPAGMTAALFAAKSGAKVRLIDVNEQVGRKLLVTGSGRANLTNQQMEASRYSCSDIGWMNSLLTRFGHNELINFFREIGVLTFSTADGWCYPISESAQTVVEMFANALRLANIELILNTKVLSIRSNNEGLNLDLSSGTTLTTDRLILAAGGKAYPTLGSRGELFASLKNLGHTINPLVPALAPVTCDMKPWFMSNKKAVKSHELTGIRFDARVSLFQNTRLLAETTGNLIFTEWGVNGPAVMDLSHHISTRPDSKLEMKINPLFISEIALRELISRKKETNTPMRVLLGSVLPPKLPPILLIRSGYPVDIAVNQLNKEQIEKVINLAAALPFKVTGVRGFEYCQVSAGGVPVSEVDPLNMRSRKVQGLALVGETLDVVGPCGGYNLQFAFSSGAVAGMEITK